MEDLTELVKVLGPVGSAVVVVIVVVLVILEDFIPKEIKYRKEIF